MQKLSRRQIASYAVNLMASGKTSQLAPKLAAALIANNKSSQVSELIQDIAYELEERKLASYAHVTTTEKLNSSLKKEIEKFVARKTDAKQVVLEEEIDPSVIGGLRLETSKHAWDKTIKRSLTDIQEAF